MKKNEGVTLISLVITIIILVILTGVSITMIIGNQGLFAKLKTSKDIYKNAQDKENLSISEYENQIDNINGPILPKRKIINYAEKENILTYNVSTNQYTAPKNGYIFIPSFFTRSAGTLTIYIDNIIVAWNVASDSNAYRDSICLPIAKSSTVYYVAKGNYGLDYGIYFVPRG